MYIERNRQWCHHYTHNTLHHQTQPASSSMKSKLSKHSFLLPQQLEKPELCSVAPPGQPAASQGQHQTGTAAEYGTSSKKNTT